MLVEEVARYAERSRCFIRGESEPGDKILGLTGSGARMRNLPFVHAPSC